MSKFYITKRDCIRPVKIEDSGPNSIPPMTVPEMYRNACEKWRDKPYLRFQPSLVSPWNEISFVTYFEMLRKVAKSLIFLGLKARKGVGICGFNSVEWFSSCLGSIFAGCISIGIYQTTSKEKCHTIVNESDMEVVFVDTNENLEKFIALESSPLKYIVQWGCQSNRDGVIPFNEFLELGIAVSDKELDERIKNQNPGSCCSLIYTSGTMGESKAAMISHDNITWVVREIVPYLGLWEEIALSYLPLSHIAASMIEMHGSCHCGATICFAQPDCFKGSLIETMRSVRPTAFIGVPRVYEKFMEQMLEIGKRQNSVVKYIAGIAKDIGRRGNMNLMLGQNVPWGWTLAGMVFDTVKRKLGLERCHILFTAAAPIPIPVQEYFLSLDLPLFDLYGSTETTGPISLSIRQTGKYYLGAQGAGIPGQNMAILDKACNELPKNEVGEICVKGRHVFLGYLDTDTDSFDMNGFFHTGDMGYIDSRGFLFVTGRLKEVIITAGGENVSPNPIEKRVKTLLKDEPVSHVVVIGNGRKYIIVLVIADSEEVDSGRVRVAIHEANTHAVNRIAQIKRFAIINDTLSDVTGELTPTMKIKRHIIEKKYESIIEEVYGSSDHDVERHDSHIKGAAFSL